MSAERVKKLCDDITSARNEVLSIVESLSPEQFARPTVNDGWSVREVMIHLATIPARNMDMWSHAIAGKDWTGEKKVDDFSRKQIELRKDTPDADIVKEYRQATDEQIAFLQTMDPAMMDREWDHPAASLGRTTLEKMAIAGPPHHRKHGAEIKAAVAG